ncbi:MAG: hypothetical protein R3B48_14945 [Kofleriaceae bacterium]
MINATRTVNEVVASCGESGALWLERDVWVDERSPVSVKVIGWTAVGSGAVRCCQARLTKDFTSAGTMAIVVVMHLAA